MLLLVIAFTYQKHRFGGGLINKNYTLFFTQTLFSAKNILLAFCEEDRSDPDFQPIISHKPPFSPYNGIFK